MAPKAMCWTTALCWRWLAPNMPLCVKVTQLCLTLCDPMDYTVHGIFQARILEWVTIPFSRGSFWPRNWTGVSCIAGGFFFLPAQLPGKPPTGKHARSDGELLGDTLDFRKVSLLIWGRGCCLWSGTQLWWSPSLLLWPACLKAQVISPLTYEMGTKPSSLDFTGGPLV